MANTNSANARFVDVHTCDETKFINIIVYEIQRQFSIRNVVILLTLNEEIWKKRLAFKTYKDFVFSGDGDLVIYNIRDMLDKNFISNCSYLKRDILSNIDTYRKTFQSSAKILNKNSIHSNTRHITWIFDNDIPHHFYNSRVFMDTLQNGRRISSNVFIFRMLSRNISANKNIPLIVKLQSTKSIIKPANFTQNNIIQSKL